MDYMYNYISGLEVLHLVSTSVLVGLIWMIQLIIYPSFRFIAEDKWQAFHQMHTRRVSYLVIWLMPVELFLTFIVVSHHGFSGLNILMLVCLVVVWGSTFLLQVPAHNKLAKYQSQNEIQFLIKSNWLRTIAWTVKLSILLAW